MSPSKSLQLGVGRSAVLLRTLALVVVLAMFSAACGGSSEQAAPTEDTVEPATAEPPASTPDTEADDDSDQAASPQAATNDEVATGDEASSDDSATEQEDEVEDTSEPVEVVPAAETIEWEPCASQTSCGFIDVPAVYSDDSAGTISIAVNVLRAHDPEAREGYLFVNPGGPGASGIELVGNAALSFTDEILDSFDIIGFDPRGVGASEPQFACGTGNEMFELLGQIDDEPDTPEEIELGTQAAQLCVDSMGPAALALDSESVARDMDEIRKALGIDQISYLGFSYGSTLGGWYATLFPEHVRAMVVDGADNPVAQIDTIDEKIEELRNTAGPFHDQLELALAACDSTACPIWNDGDPIGFYNQAVEKIDLVVEAAEGNPDAGIASIVTPLYAEAQWPGLHAGLRELAEAEDASDINILLQFAAEQGLDKAEPSFTLHVNCLDGRRLFPDETLADALADSDAIEAATEGEFPLFDSIEPQDSASVCAFFEFLDIEPFEGTLDGSDVPIMVVGNTSDPATPFVKSEQFANEVLSNAVLVQVDHAQHVVYPANSCVNDYVHAALIDLEYPSSTVTCEREEIEFPEASGELGTFEPVELPDGSTTVRPGGWVQLAAGLFSRGDLSQDPTALIFEPTAGDIEAAVASVEAQALGTPAEEGPELEFNGVTWRAFEINLEDAGITIRMAASPGADGHLVIGQAFSNEIDEITETVLIPALEAFIPAE